MASVEQMDSGPRSIIERLLPIYQMLIAAEAIRLYSCPLLVVQNSALFLVMKMSTSLHADHYYTTVAVLMQEVVKLVVSLVCIMAGESAVCAPLRRMWGLRRQMLVLLVPCICYIGQNNLLYVGVANLPAAVAQVLVQTKLLWAAVFSITMLGKRFSKEAWASFIVLVAGVVLVNNAKGSGGGGSSSDLGVGAAVLGMIASMAAAALSGFAGVFLEKTFNKGSTTLLEMNVWLALISMPLQGLAILQFDRVGILRNGLFHGFHRDTWGVILIQAVGGLLTSVGLPDDL
jgi:UDP-sugar transporter A1/2/3